MMLRQSNRTYNTHMTLFCTHFARYFCCFRFFSIFVVVVVAFCRVASKKSKQFQQIHDNFACVRACVRARAKRLDHGNIFIDNLIWVLLFDLSLPLFFRYFDASCLHAWPNSVWILIWPIVFSHVLTFKMIDFPGQMEIFFQHIKQLFIDGKWQSLKLISNKQTQEERLCVSDIFKWP